jgi:hypothetical protein
MLAEPLRRLLDSALHCLRGRTGRRVRPLEPLELAVEARHRFGEGGRAFVRPRVQRRELGLALAVPSFFLLREAERLHLPRLRVPP